MRIGSTNAVLVAALALTMVAWGCGAPAEAQPLEVTYYYLPG